jgi:GAF domain-containing protein
MTVNSEPAWASDFRVMHDLLAIPTQFTDANSALARLTEVAREPLSAHACLVMRAGVKPETFVTVACKAVDPELAQLLMGAELPKDTPFDPDAAARRLEHEVRAAGATSVLCRPIVSGSDDVVGVFACLVAQGSVSDISVRMVDLLATQAGAIIACLESRPEALDTITRLKKLSTSVLTDKRDPAEEDVARGCCELLSVPVCIVWKRAEHEQLLRVVAASDTVDAAYRSLKLQLDSPGIVAALKGRAVKWIEDVRIPQDRYGHSKMAEERGWVSMLSVPMFVADRLVGMVDVYTTERRRFESREHEVFTTFANYMAFSLNRSESRRRLEATIGLLRAMSAAPKVEDLISIFLRGSLDVVGTTQGWIGRLDPRTGELRVEPAGGEPPGGRTLKWGEGVCGSAVARGTAINVGDVTADEWRGRHESFWPDTQSVLAIPLVVPHAEVRERAKVENGTKTIGVISFESPRRKAFTRTFENLLVSLTQHAAVGIDKLELDERVKSLREVEKQIGQIDTFKETAQAVLGAVRSRLGYDAVNISIVDPEIRRIKTEFVDIDGLSAEEMDEFKRMADHSLTSDDIQAYVVAEGRAEVPSRTMDAETPYRFDPEIFARFGHHNLVRVFVPMRLPDNRVIGTIEAGYRQAYPRFIYEADVRVLQDFADYAARALEHNNLYSFNWEVRSFLDEGLAAVGATQGVVLMCDKKTDALHVIERKGRPPKPGNVPLTVRDGSAGLAILSGTPRIIGDVLDPRQAPEFLPARTGSPTFRSMLIVPILHGGRALGAICALDLEPNKFTDAHAKRLMDDCESFAPKMDQLGVDAFMGHTKRLLELERFHGVAEELARLTLDLDTLREHIVEAAEAILEASPVVLYLYDEKRKKFEVPPTLSRDIRQRGAMTGAVFDRHAPYRIVQKGESHFAAAAASDDIMNGESGPGGDSFVVREGIASSAGILLKADETTVGVLFANYRRSRTFSSYERHKIGGFAGNVALAIQKARAVRDTMRRTHQTALRRNRDDMAHRLKGPLISMDWQFVKIGRLATTSSEVREWADLASGLNRHVQQLVKEFNAEPHRPGSVTPVAAAELAELIKKTLAVSRTREETTTSVRVDGRLPTIPLDRGKLRDDFINLLHDSERHAVGAAVVDVDVDLAEPRDVEELRLAPGKRFVRIVYRDRGPGIRPDLKERVFEPWFFIAGGSGRTGHGLAILRENAIARGGTARECGEYGKGVRFEIYVPASDVSSARL